MHCLALDTKQLADHALAADTDCAPAHLQYGILLFARNLLRNDTDSRQPYVTPMNGDVKDLPPTLLVTNGFDPLRDVGHAYARKARGAAAACGSSICSGSLMHGMMRSSQPLATVSRSCTTRT